MSKDQLISNMAASIQLMHRLSRSSANSSLIKALLPRQSVTCMAVTRQYSDSVHNTVNDFQVALSHDKKTVICWHPEKKFPYKHSKAIPRKEEELGEGDSVLKVKHLLSEKKKYPRDGPSDRELMKIFHTTRHRWDPKPQRRLAEEPPANPRKAL